MGTVWNTQLVAAKSHEHSWWADSFQQKQKPRAKWNLWDIIKTHQVIRRSLREQHCDRGDIRRPLLKGAESILDHSCCMNQCLFDHVHARVRQGITNTSEPGCLHLGIMFSLVDATTDNGRKTWTKNDHSIHFSWSKAKDPKAGSPEQLGVLFVPASPVAHNQIRETAPGQEGPRIYTLGILSHNFPHFTLGKMPSETLSPAPNRG